VGFRSPEDQARCQREQDEKLIKQLQADHPQIDFSSVVIRPRGRVLGPPRRPIDPFAAVLEFPDDPSPKPRRWLPLAPHLVEPGISIKWEPLPVPTFHKAVRDDDSTHDCPAVRPVSIPIGPVTERLLELRDDESLTTDEFLRIRSKPDPDPLGSVRMRAKSLWGN
jgi:hypothetical protein